MVKQTFVIVDIVVQWVNVLPKNKYMIRQNSVLIKLPVN